MPSDAVRLKFAYLLNALDVARAIGNNGTLRFPRAIACTLSVVLQFGNAVDVYLWDAALGPTFAPARPRLQCSTTDGNCAASVTQKLSPSAQFYFKYVPSIQTDLTLRIAIDICTASCLIGSIIGSLIPL